jgi:hypothetical protein
VNAFLVLPCEKQMAKTDSGKPGLPADCFFDSFTGRRLQNTLKPYI